MTLSSILPFLERQAQSRPCIPRSLWFDEGGVVVYLRAGRVHSQDGETMLACGVANVTAYPVRQGKFTAFLDTLEQETAKLGYEVIRVEQVMHPWFVQFLERRGYSVQLPLQGLPVLSKMLNI